MRLTVIVLTVCLCASELLAFDGNEHRELANRAVRLALDNARARGVAGEILAQAEAMIHHDAVRQRRSFGDLTIVVDWFSNPPRLENPGSAWREIAWRRYNFFMRGVAIHRNLDHFQQAALDQYAALHGRAVTHARNGDFPRALHAEALAIHYLQDFFAPGHVFVARVTANDAVSGSLHDYANHHGVKFVFDRIADKKDPEAWRGLLADAEKLPGVKEPQIPLVLDPAKIATLREQLETLEEGYVLTAPFYGDGNLRREPTQAALLVAITARSVDAVLSAGAGAAPPTSLWLCFEPESWQPTAKKDEYRVFPPRGAFGLHKPASETSIVEKRCGDEWLGGYAAGLTTTAEEPEPPVYQLGWTEARTRRGGGDERRTASAMMVFPMSTRGGTVLRDAEGNLTDKRMRTYISSVGWGASRSEAAHYTSWGLNMEVTTHRVAGISLSGFGGYHRYFHDGRHDNRIDFGARGRFGIDLASVVFSIENAHTVSESRRVSRRIFVAAGVEMAISGSWAELAQRTVMRPFRKEND